MERGQYGVGVLLIVMANGRYAVMDALAREHGGDGAWPAFDTIDIAGHRALPRLSGGRGSRPTRSCVRTLDEVLPGLAARAEPLLIEVVVA